MDLSYLLSNSLAPVQKGLLSYLGPVNFLALARVSKSVKNGLNSFVYNIDTKLGKFFNDAQAFRKLQAELDILIGDVEGNFVRSFFSNDPTPSTCTRTTYRTSHVSWMKLAMTSKTTMWSSMVEDDYHIPSKQKAARS
jgi:hypothetical protein